MIGIRTDIQLRIIKEITWQKYLAKQSFKIRMRHPEGCLFVTKGCENLECEVYCCQCQKVQKTTIDNKGILGDSCEHINGYLVTDCHIIKFPDNAVGVSAH